MIIYIIRHGDNDSLGNYLPGRKPGIHLNEAGLIQANTVAESLRNTGIQKIYSSPLERAVETAQPLAGQINLSIQLEPDLLEMDAGEFTGTLFPELKEMELWNKIRQDPVHNGFPGGEKFPEAQQRVWGAIERIHQSHHAEDVVAVFSHADCIKMIVTRAMQMPLSFFPRLGVDPASLTILGFKKETIWLGGLNLHPPYNLPQFDVKNQHTN